MSPTISCNRGHFGNSTGCHPCPIGTFHDGKVFVTKCTKCPAGSFQSKTGAHECISCVPGSFQEKEGQSECVKCREGGYCSDASPNSCDGGFTPCPSGTYNEFRGSVNETACLPCPSGE